jgi:hypothetical protein
LSGSSKGKYMKFRKASVSLIGLSIIAGAIAPVTFAPVAAQATPIYEITGTLQVGQTAYASPGSWPDGYAVAYQWRVNGINIEGATDTSYAIQPGDDGKRLSVVLTGTKDGFPTITRLETNHALVALGDMIDLGTPTLSANLDVIRPGTRLSVIIGGGLDQAAHVQVDWLRNGVQYASSTTYQRYVSFQDLGKGISVRLTETRFGYKTQKRVSTQVQVIKYTRQFPVPTPYIVGNAVYGSTLEVYFDLPTCIGCNTSYIWARNGVDIAGTENQLDYTLGLGDLGKRITVKFYSTLSETYDEKRTSPSTSPVALAQFISQETPTIIGDAVVGQALGAFVGSWDPAANLSYQWYRGGATIPGANSNYYTLTSGDLGQRIAVKVTAIATGYRTVKLISGYTGNVQP